MLYVAVYQLWWSEGYQDFADVESGVTTKVEQLTLYITIWERSLNSYLYLSFDHLLHYSTDSINAEKIIKKYEANLAHEDRSSLNFIKFPLGEGLLSGSPGEY